jgi:hypothetical protein
VKTLLEDPFIAALIFWLLMIPILLGAMSIDEKYFKNEKKCIQQNGDNNSIENYLIFKGAGGMPGIP